MSTEISPVVVVGEETEPAEINATQLRLLPVHSPLVARFGAEFFRGLPQRPGVYLMRDERDHLIYVGKAKNLRQRLNSYRYPARVSRKTVRLVHAVRRIEWELCDSDEAAQLRENALIRAHRPRFNRLGTWPKVNCFILMQTGDARLRFAVTRQAVAPTIGAPVSEPAMLKEGTREAGAPFSACLSFAANTAAKSEFAELPERDRPRAQGCQTASDVPAAVDGRTPHDLNLTPSACLTDEGLDGTGVNDGNTAQLFGAFKPGAAWALAALLRLLWQALHQIDERTALPRRLLAEKSPAAFDLDHQTAPAWMDSLAAYFKGESSAVIDVLSASLPAAATTFEEQARQADLERLQHFFLVGPRLNRELNHRRANPGLPISQEELDDLMVLRRRENTAVTAPTP